MATCKTSQSPNTCPYVQLDVVEYSHDDISVTLQWTLKYTAAHRVNTDGQERAWSVNVDGSLAKNGYYDINGVTGTRQLGTGTYKVPRYSKTRSVPFSVSFNFGVTYSGTAMGTRSASGSYSIGPTTSYTITYNANGGSGAPGQQTKWHSVALTLSTTKPTRTGYTFKSWNTNSSGTGTIYPSGGTYTANSAATLYAQWSIDTWKVTYNANGGSGAPSAQTKTYGASLKLSSTKPTRTGYTFDGWYANASGTGTKYNPGDTYTSNAALTLYAKWTLITYKVTYNANGGSGAPAQQTKNYGQTLTLSSTKPTKSNYNFMGWATSATGSVAYTSGASYTTNAAITLYAVWELASEDPVISNLTIVRKRIDGTDVIDDPLDGDIAVVDFDYIFDSNTHGDEAYYTISSKTTKTYLPYDEDFSTKSSGHMQFTIESVTNLVDSVLYLTIVDMNGLTATKSIRLTAGEYRIDYFDDDAVGVSVGMPASQPGFHVNPTATFHNDIYMKPDDPKVEADIFFETGSGGSHEHRASIYGSCSDSETAIGMWDNKNSRSILQYLDEVNLLYLGNGLADSRIAMKGSMVSFVPAFTEASGGEILDHMTSVFNKLPEDEVCVFKVTWGSRFTCIGHRYSSNASGSMIWLKYTGDMYIFRRASSVDSVKLYSFDDDSGWKTQGKVDYRKVGNVVYVNCWQSGSTTLGKDTVQTVATLPSGYRPTHSACHAIGHVSGGGSGNGVCTVTVNTSGSVTVEPQIACKQYDFSLSFLID